MDPSVSKPQANRKLFLKHILRKIFLEDWALKLLALAITFGLWFTVTGLSTPATKRLNVPLNLSIASDAQIVNSPLQEVVIDISGDKSRLEQINRAELSATLDLTDFKPGSWAVSLSPDTVIVSLPQGIKLVEVQPSRIAVNLEAVEEKELEVRAETTGKIASGYEIYSSSILPPSIRVRGPASIIKTLEYVQTDAVDVTGRTSEFTARQVAVRSPDPKAAVLNTVVDIIFRIGEKRIERTFVFPLDEQSKDVATFVIYGPRSLLAKTRVEAFKIDVSDRTAPEVILPAELRDVVEVRKIVLK